MNKSQKGFNGQQKAKLRRERTIVRLETQLKSGIKVTKDVEFLEGGTKGHLTSALEEQDVKRIKSELLTLKSRV